MKTLLETILSRKLFDPKVAIYNWLDEHEIKNYTVNDKGEVDVDGNVNLSSCDLIEIPSFIQFGTVKGYFTCCYSRLTTLRGCPRIVKKNFYCHGNNLTTLEGAPREVGGDFICYANNLTTLEGAPEKVEGKFNCKVNTTKFTEDDVKKVCKVKGKIAV